MYKDMNHSIIRTVVAALFIIFVCPYLAAQDATSQSTWPQFRGSDFNPILENEKLPDRWSKTENIEWSIEVDGRGWSSPIVVDGKVFLTSVTTDGQSKSPQSGTDYSNEYVAELMKQGLSAEEVERKVNERDFEMPDQVSLHYHLVCIDLKSGRELWKQEYHTGKPPGGRHRKNSFASETPVTDGKFIYVYSTHLGLFAYDFTGQQIWHTELENHPIYLEFGSGTSPVILDDKLIIVDDNQEHSTISAYSTADGKLVWKTDRNVPEDYPEQMPRSAWATPYVWKNALRTEIVTISPGVAVSYDKNGRFSAPSAALYSLNDNRARGFPRIIDTGFAGNGAAETSDSRDLREDPHRGLVRQRVSTRARRHDRRRRRALRSGRVRQQRRARAQDRSAGHAAQLVGDRARPRGLGRQSVPVQRARGAPGQRRPSRLSSCRLPHLASQRRQRPDGAAARAVRGRQPRHAGCPGRARRVHELVSALAARQRRRFPVHRAHGHHRRPADRL